MGRTLQMLNVYGDFVENYLAIPVVKGEKSESERFPGAVNTYCLEAMMQDRKALQAGTSHFLGQNFARASEIKYQSAQEKEEYAWTTSWGVSTRLIGAMIMTHSDDDGLVLPPKLASAQIVLLPIVKKETDKDRVMTFTHALAKELADIRYHDRGLVVEIDSRDMGGKNWDWIKKGVPVRVEIGPRDIAENAVCVGRRDRPPKEKASVTRDAFLGSVASVLDEIQRNLFDRALAFRKQHSVPMDSLQDFYAFFTPQNEAKPEIHGGFAYAHWCGNAACEEKIKTDLKVTIRCIPFDDENEVGACIVCGDKSRKRVVFAKAY
jgi:prolyl-tRNA synthetase